MQRQTIRLKVKTNKDINMIVAIQKNKTMQELAHRVLNCFHELANQHSKSPPKRRDLAVSALKLDGYYISKSQIVCSMLCDQDQIQCILSKARPKYPNQPLTYESSKKLVPRENWHSSNSRQLSPPKKDNNVVERKDRQLEGGQLIERSKRQIKKDKKKNKLKQKNKQVLLQQSELNVQKKKKQNIVSTLVISPLQFVDGSKMEEQGIQQRGNQKHLEESVKNFVKEEKKMKKEVEHIKNEVHNSVAKINENKMQQEQKQENRNVDQIREIQKQGQGKGQRQREGRKQTQIQKIQSLQREENPFESEDENVNISYRKEIRKENDVDSSGEEPVLNIYNKNKKKNKKKNKNKNENQKIGGLKNQILNDGREQLPMGIQRNKINTIIGMLQKVNEQKQKRMKKKQKRVEKLEENEMENKNNGVFGNGEQNLYENKGGVSMVSNNNKIASPKVTFHTSPLNSPQIISLNSPKRKFSNPSVDKLDKLDLQENLDINKSLKKPLQSQKKPLQPIQEVKKGAVIQGAPKIIVQQQSQAQSPDMPNKKQQEVVSFKKLEHVSNPKIAALQATLSKYNLNFQDSEDDEQ